MRRMLRITCTESIIKETVLRKMNIDTDILRCFRRRKAGLPGKHYTGSIYDNLTGLHRHSWLKRTGIIHHKKKVACHRERACMITPRNIYLPLMSQANVCFLVSSQISCCNFIPSFIRTVGIIIIVTSCSYA